MLSIRSLMLSVLSVAVVVAALRDPSEFAARALFNLTLMLLLTGILGTFLCGGKDRAGWAGLALFGAAYITFNLGFGELAATTNVTDYLFARLHSPEEAGLPHYRCRDSLHDLQ
jgi:hypothetical protein